MLLRIMSNAKTPRGPTVRGEGQRPNGVVSLRPRFMRLMPAQGMCVEDASEVCSPPVKSRGIMSYKISGDRITFNCPTCGAELDSPLEEAGQSFPCPTCGRQFMTPGLEELSNARSSEKLKPISAGWKLRNYSGRRWRIAVPLKENMHCWMRRRKPSGRDRSRRIN